MDLDDLLAKGESSTPPAPLPIEQPKARSEDRPEWLDKKPKAASLDDLLARGEGGAPPGTFKNTGPVAGIESDLAKAKAALPTTGDIVRHGAEAGATAVGDFLDTASFGGYRKLRDAAAGLVSPDSVTAVQQKEKETHDALAGSTGGQLLQNTTSG